MNKHQKLVQQQFLNDEEALIKLLQATYSRSLKDIEKETKKLQKQIETLDVQYDILEDHLSDEEKEQLLSMKRSKVYQKNYQDSLKKQVSDILDTMHDEEFKTVSGYINKCYEQGFIGTMYDLQGQGIPLAFPLDQEAVVRAVQLDSKIKKGLYSHLGENVAQLKKHIAAEISRGISTGMSFAQIAQQLSLRMQGTYENPGGSLAYAMRIARTEGHRVQVQSAMDACFKAKDSGADVVKQWDAALDKRTRASHQHVDGEIRELDEPFSNGLMFPGDPDGGAAEVVNCRCALLQRARWALDDDELEALKERANYFGLDKTDSFDDFKSKYIDAVKAPKTKPKKEYLTKKKLEQKISDGKDELKQLHADFEAETGGWTYDEVIKDFDSLEDFADGDVLDKLKAYEKQMKEVSENVDEWEELLNKKVVASETKKLKKKQILLQDELDQFDDTETFSGIWYNQDDITIKDWKMKQSSIQKKIDYYEDQIKLAKQLGNQDDVDKFTDLLEKVKDFDKKGKAYWKIKDELDDTTTQLKKLKKSGKINGQKNIDDDAFTQERKDAAMWAKSTKDADARLRDKCGDVWQKADQQERYAIYDYTSGSGKFNRPLSGFEKPYAEYGTGWEPKYNKGVGNVWIDYEGAGDEIRHMTNLISQSSYDFDIWLQRGCGGNAMESFLGLSPGTFTSMSDSELQQFVGQSNRMYSFTSTGVAKGKGFSGDCILNIYAPAGTQMMYAEPFSRFGNGSGLQWNGISSQSSFGYESEMIIQRGASYTITKIEKSGGTIFIDMEVHPEDGYDLIQQDPAEWKGSTKKGR